MKTKDPVNPNTKFYHLSGSVLDAEDTLVGESDVAPCAAGKAAPINPTRSGGSAMRKGGAV